MHRFSFAAEPSHIAPHAPKHPAGMLHATPTKPLLQLQVPSLPQLPFPEQSRGQRASSQLGPVLVSSMQILERQSAPFQPTLQTHFDAIQRPLPEQQVWQRLVRVACEQSSPVNPGLHTHSPGEWGLENTQSPWGGEQSFLHCGSWGRRECRRL